MSEKKQPEIKNAVVLRNACKSYNSGKRKLVVLRYLNMTVPSGTIYGLLGPSGGGKTTLLTCITGGHKLDSGTILVLGRKPGARNSGVPGTKLGFMPQEIALHGSFTIKGTFMYFGWMYGMTKKQINEKFDFFMEFLGLPPINPKFVRNLSAGQQRRLSFAVAIMHEPELIILDEPTVGVDPLLRRKLWDYLAAITATHRQSIIITTHYIEEARQAHTIGLIRDGVLLAEDTPDALLTKFKTQSLNDVFLKLVHSSTVDTTIVPKKYSSEHEDLSIHSISKKEQWKITAISSRGKAKALASKHFILMFTNISLMLFVFLLPVVQISLFCLTIGRNFTDLNLAIVNHEVNQSEHDQHICPIKTSCQEGLLSCTIISSISNDTVNKMDFETVDEGLKAVRNGKAWGVIFMPENFTESLRRRVLYGSSEGETQIKAWFDMTNQQVSLTIKAAIQDAIISTFRNTLALCHMESRLADIPLKFGDPVYGDTEFTFREFVAPGVVIIVIFFSALSLTATDLIVEKREGMLTRDWSVGVKFYEVILFQAMIKLLAIIIQVAVSLVTLFGFFEVHNEGNWFNIIFISLLQGIAGFTFGFFISVINKSERNAINVALGSFFPLVLLSGIFWPLESLNEGVRYLCYCLPNTMAASSLRNIITRGWSLSKFEVYIGHIASVAWIIVFSFSSVMILSFKKG